MIHFVELIKAIEQSSEKYERVEALLYYLSIAKAEDKIWTLALLENKGPRGLIKVKQVKDWAIEAANISPWLFERSMTLVGDQVETLTLILPEASEPKEESLSNWINSIAGLKKQSLETQKEFVTQAWDQLKANQRYAFNKLLVGSWKINFPTLEIAEALSRYLSMESWQITLKLAADWSPMKISFEDLFEHDKKDALSKPYLLSEPEVLEDENRIPTIEDLEVLRWMDGVQIQVIKREGRVSIWTLDGRLITNKVPELAILEEHSFDNFMLAGNLLGFKEDWLALNQVESRLKLKRVSKKILEEVPLICVFHDLLELEGIDKRGDRHIDRFEVLEAIVVDEFEGVNAVLIAEKIEVDHLEGLKQARNEARNYKALGVLIRHKWSRGQDNVFLWKAPFLYIKAVLLYAQRSASRRPGQYVEYTFALRDGDDLIPITKTYEGLSEEEHKELGLWIKSNTIERFGPVYSVEPEQIFELSYEGVEVSKRRKSGVVLKGVKIVKWMRDCGLGELGRLRELSG